jgi:hypothetical protein
MGLLDDAIREHLELRRRHGADPREVTSKEHEALGPAAVRAGDVLTAPADADDVLFAAEPSMIDGNMTAEDRRLERRARPVPEGTSNDAYLSQETVELDMRTVMHEDGSVEIDYAARGGVRSTSAAPVRALH